MSPPVSGFKSWNSMAAEEEPTSEYFSAETWSEHLENQAKAPVIHELEDTSIQDSDVESD